MLPLVVRHLARLIWDRVWPLRVVAQVVALLVQVALVVLVVLVHPVPQLLRALVRPLVELLWL